jgi:predicted branched-subunit amino acid permease
LGNNARSSFYAGARATLPVLLGIVPFGVITGVAMVASGIPPLVAMLMSVVVFAGASMVASAQLLTSQAPALLIIRRKCWCRMNNCPPALSQLLWRGAGARPSLR